MKLDTPVVASALGLTVGRIEIAIDGDDAKGATDSARSRRMGDYGKINTPGPQPVLGNLVGYEAATIPTSIKSQRNSISMGLLIRMGEGERLRAAILT
jgi:hypothetical protein